ncbi:GNAT family N-acetyltransferase [Mitsuaria sp. WAJ17]|uniref:GNAT family N-acetyltransferase n=1 Tax=Mitsuaria sp. WAJ17 TaxID=2761452 RepID=UPI001601C42B|nr:GNAT family N-acetyltransferase [Mitsuaria sp. WAJ17]MBB2487185.1 GNAT family N-acetyltransferase [Mitsuaria sp. WAJ17]
MQNALLRDLDPARHDEIDRVAQGMRQTLIEVEGEARGTAMYSLDWLRDRVRWHLDPAQTQARVVLAVDARGEVLAHTIFRIEGPVVARFGLISTTFVWPTHRRAGLATRLLRCAEDWFLAQGLPKCCTWTSSTNRPLIALYGRHGYAQTDQGPNDLTGTLMIQLSKPLLCATSPRKP